MNIDLVDRCVDWIWGKLTDYTHVAYDVFKEMCAFDYALINLNISNFP